MDLSRLPPSRHPDRPTRGLERAALIGAVGAGVPAWILGAVLLTRHFDTLPPDGFKGLAYAVALFGIVVLAAVAGAIAAAAVAIARSTDEELRRPRVVLSMAALALPVMLVLAPFGFLALTLGGHRAIGFVGVAGVALGVRWGVRLGYHSVLHGDTASLLAGRSPRGDRPE